MRDRKVDIRNVFMAGIPRGGCAKLGTRNRKVGSSAKEVRFLPAVWYPCLSCLRCLRTSWGTRRNMRASSVSITSCNRRELNLSNRINHGLVGHTLSQYNKNPSTRTHTTFSPACSRSFWILVKVSRQRSIVSCSMGTSTCLFR